MSTTLTDGQRLGDYEILSVAGVGGMGVVYKVRQQSLGRLVALKVIADEIATQPEYVERFLREARLAASVSHPHVVSVYDVNEQDDRLYLAMQWVDGEDLQQLLHREGRLSPDRAVMVATQIAGALDAVHTAGLVHRDVKPANVLLGRVDGQDHAYLTDFGVAKPSSSADQLTQRGAVTGTTGYLSPEQIKGGPPDTRSDLYSLGCLLFEALTGQPPFSGSNEMAIRWAHASNPRPLASVVAPGLSRSYDEFFVTALAVDPDKRFASGRAFAQALVAAHEGGGAAAAAEPTVPAHTPTTVGPPTPMPPVAQAPPAGGYPAYGYVTPPPGYPPPAQSRSGNPLALLLLALVAIAGIAAGALAAAGAFSHGTPTRTQTVGSPAGSANRSAYPAPSSAPVSGTTSCGGDLSVGANTSCPFARNVEQAYDQSSGGNTPVTAYSPTTGTTYTIDCTGGTPHVCSGGTTNNASVYFSSGPSSGSAASGSATPAGANTAGMHACDQNISANGDTSCPFAENVFVAYWQDYKQNGQQSNSTVSAFSPTTNQSYSMNCNNDGTTVGCAGGNGAFVTFPLRAVAEYQGPS